MAKACAPIALGNDSTYVLHSIHEPACSPSVLLTVLCRSTYMPCQPLASVIKITGTCNTGAREDLKSMQTCCGMFTTLQSITHPVNDSVEQIKTSNF